MNAADSKWTYGGTWGESPDATPRSMAALVTVCLCAALLVAGPVRPAAAVSAGEIEDAGLFFSGEGGDMQAAPLVHTDAYLKVTGIILRAQITQEFFNPSDDWVEGIYFFPLPETGAVDHLRMIVGTRIVEGEIQEKAEARRTYERAKSVGKKASLLVQKRPNVFRVDVANIGPRESVQIVIEFQDSVRYDSGELRLRLPTLVAPRFVPLLTPLSEPALSREVVEAAAFGVASCGGPPAATSTLTLTVDLQPGFPLKWVHSPSHAVQTVETADSFLVRVDDDSGLADRDFVLAWAPRIGSAPGTAVFREETDEDSYVLLMVLPPDPVTDGRPPLPREVVFVIDTSGSMHGESLQQAKLALLLALDSLTPDDSFNVIQFDSRTALLFPESVPATPAAREQAREYVDSLRADGGTFMLPALAAALEDTGAHRAVRQVVFVTDGGVGNEEELFTFIARSLGRSRLFTVGIGAAPNAHFMRKAAHFGRGTFTYIGTPDEVSARMDSLFEKLEAPVVADIGVEWDDPGADAWPSLVPDLYAGEPVVVVARLADADGAVHVAGLAGLQPWSQAISLRGDGDDVQPAATLFEGTGQGIAQLWARRRIEALMDGIVRGTDAESVRREVTALGLQHHLVTRYTSLVAVDLTPTAPFGVEPQARRVAPVAARQVGALPATATSMPFDLLLGFLATLVAAALWRRRGVPCN